MVALHPVTIHPLQNGDHGYTQYKIHYVTILGSAHGRSLLSIYVMVGVTIPHIGT